MTQQTVFPRWRGFNLLGMFCSQQSPINRGRAPGYFDEEDFRMIADFGFDFVRLPLSYRVWGGGDDPFRIDEAKLAPLDQAVAFGEKYGLHVDLCMHRIPGYCINQDETERLNLWTDDEALDAAKAHWTAIARRYVGVPSSRLSFNVVNEVSGSVYLRQYARVATAIIDAVREISPDRLFILDGLNAGDIPPVDQMMLLENCGYSCRGYAPRGVTHYKTHITAYDDLLPVWPGAVQDEYNGKRTVWDAEKLDRYYGMFAALAENFHVGVHCGEMGCANRTPHSVALAWMESMMQTLKAHNIGYALWNFRGAFGVMDSDRDDAEYINCGGHRLDRKMMQLLQRY